MENDTGTDRQIPSERPGLMKFVSPETEGFRREIRSAGIVFIGCFILELLSLWLRSHHGEVALPLVPVAGFAFAALLVFSEKAILPFLAAITAAGFAFHPGNFLAVYLPSLGLGVVLGWVLSRRFFSRRRLEAPLLRPNETPFFFIGGGICAAALTASFLVGGSQLMGPPQDSRPAFFWMQNFLAILAGFMALTPASYYLLRGDFSTPVKNHRAAETVLLFSALFASVFVAVLTPIPPHLRESFVIIIPFPVLIWIALRRGLRPTSLALAIISIAILTFYYLWNKTASRTPALTDGLHQIHFIFLAVSCLLLASQRDAIGALTLKTRLADEAGDFCAWEWGLHAGITFWSTGWTARTGIPSETPMPLERWIATVHPDDQEEFAETITRGALNPTPGFTMRFRSWDVERNDWYWAKSIGHLIKLDPQGNPLKAVGVVLDINDVVETEKMRVAVAQNKAELAALRAQLNPHFLFNCLNSIRALIGRDEAKAREMVTTLATLLRSLLEQRNESFETVGAEIAIIRKYLSLEQIRFGARLQADIAIDPLALECHIPCFLMLTLVENAVKHGISKTPEGGIVSVNVLMRAGALSISVSNPGHLREAGKGMGLENTRRRVALITSQAGSFEILENPPGRVVASVELPAPGIYLPPQPGRARGSEPKGPSDAEIPPSGAGTSRKQDPAPSQGESVPAGQT